MNLEVFVWDSPKEKVQVLKSREKAKKFGAEKFKTLISFLYYLEEKGLHYHVSTENKAKF